MVVNKKINPEKLLSIKRRGQRRSKEMGISNLDYPVKGEIIDLPKKEKKENQNIVLEKIQDAISSIEKGAIDIRETVSIEANKAEFAVQEEKINQGTKSELNEIRSEEKRVYDLVEVERKSTYSKLLEKVKSRIKSEGEEAKKGFGNGTDSLDPMEILKELEIHLSELKAEDNKYLVNELEGLTKGYKLQEQFYQDTLDSEKIDLEAIKEKEKFGESLYGEIKNYLNLLKDGTRRGYEKKLKDLSVDISKISEEKGAGLSTMVYVRELEKIRTNLRNYIINNLGEDTLKQIENDSGNEITSVIDSPDSVEDNNKQLMANNLFKECQELLKKLHPDQTQNFIRDFNEIRNKAKEMKGNGGGDEDYFIEQLNGLKEKMESAINIEGSENKKTVKEINNELGVESKKDTDANQEEPIPEGKNDQINSAIPDAETPDLSIGEVDLEKGPRFEDELTKESVGANASEEIREKGEKIMNGIDEILTLKEENLFKKAKTEYLEECRKHLSRKMTFKEKVFNLFNFKISDELQEAKTKYDVAKADYAKARYEEKKIELERNINLSQEEIEQELGRFRAEEIFEKLIIQEHQELRSKNYDSLPPKEKGHIRKGMEWYMRQHPAVKILVSTAVVTGAVTVGGSLSAGGAMMFAGMRALRSAASMGVGLASAKGVDLVLKKQAEKKMEKEMGEFKRELDTTDLNAFTIQELESKYKKILDEKGSADRRRLVIKTLTAIVSGAGLSFGLGNIDAAQTGSGVKTYQPESGSKNTASPIKPQIVAEGSGRPSEPRAESNIQTQEGIKTNTQVEDSKKTASINPEHKQISSSPETIKQTDRAIEINNKAGTRSAYFQENSSKTGGTLVIEKGSIEGSIKDYLMTQKGMDPDTAGKIAHGAAVEYSKNSNIKFDDLNHINSGAKLDFEANGNKVVIKGFLDGKGSYSKGSIYEPIKVKGVEEQISQWTDDEWNKHVNNFIKKYTDTIQNKKYFETDPSLVSDPNRMKVILTEMQNNTEKYFCENGKFTSAEYQEIKNVKVSDFLGNLKRETWSMNKWDNWAFEGSENHIGLSNRQLFRAELNDYAQKHPEVMDMKIEDALTRNIYGADTVKLVHDLQNPVKTPVSPEPVKTTQSVLVENNPKIQGQEIEQNKELDYKKIDLTEKKIKIRNIFNAENEIFNTEGKLKINNFESFLGRNKLTYEDILGYYVQNGGDPKIAEKFKIEPIEGLEGKRIARNRSTLFYNFMQKDFIKLNKPK